MPRRRAWLVMLPMSLVPLGALYHDIQRSYITTSDADLVYVYEALLYNAGYPQNNLDHPGYIYFVILGLWFRLLRLLQILPIADYTTMIAAPTATIDAAYAKLVVAGRWLSVIVSMGFVLAIFTTVVRLSRSTLAAVMAATVFALSTGLAVQSNLLRNELPSACFSFLTFAALVNASRVKSDRAGTWLILAGLFAVLALSAKIQALFVLLGLPVLLGAFVDRPVTEVARIDDEGRIARMWLTLLLALALAAPAAMMIVQTVRFHGSSGAYQALIAAYVAGLLVLYGLHQRLPASLIVTGAAALVIGIALGLLSLLIRHNAAVTQAIVMPVEHMVVFTKPTKNSVADVGGGDVAHLLLEGARVMVVSRLSLSYDPMHAHRILEMILIAGALMAARIGSWRLLAQCVMILGFAWAVEMVFGLRGMQPNYRIYLEPWLALGTGLVGAAALGRLALARPWRERMVAATIAIVFLAFLRQAADARVVDRQPVENACFQMSGVREPLAQHFYRYCITKPAP